MKIGIYLHCQGDGLGVCLRALLPDAEVVVLLAQTGLAVEEQAARVALLAGCDHVITGHFGADHGALATSALRRTVRALHQVPLFGFGGFHPDMVYVTMQGRSLDSPTGGYQSRIAILGFLAGLSVRDTEALYNKLVFARLGYFDAYAVDSQLMAERWARDGVALAPLLARWRESGCFAHTINHPKMIVLLDMARIACARMGLAPAVSDIDVARLPDSLGRGSLHPVFPDIAAAIGIAPEGCFSPGLDEYDERRVLSTAAFLNGSFERFETAPQDALLAVPGVSAGMAALGLSIAVRPARRRTHSAGMVLMTYHGSVLCQGTAPGQLLHRPLTASGADAPYVIVDCSAPAVTQGAGGLAGAVIRDADSPPLVNVSRGADYLCAERDNERAGFSRQAVSTWEGFLPLAADDLAVLRRIVAHDWLLTATGERITRALIRMADRFELQFGRWRVDLRHGFPALTGEAAEATLTLKLDGELYTLVPAPDAPEEAPDPLALLNPGRRLVLAGADAWLPPPVTAGDADRAWLYRAGRDKTALDGRPRATGAALRRDADQVLGDGLPEGRIPGLSVLVCDSWDGVDGFAWAALRLHVLSAVAPAEAVYLLPAALPEAFVQGFVALGFGGLRFVRLPPAPVMAADLIRLDMPDVTGLPAEALAGPRGRTGVRAPGARKLFWAEGLAPALAAALLAEGFEAVEAGLAPLALMGLLSQAGWVAGAAGALRLLFCPPGTRVVEFCDARVFGGEDWVMAAKLGLMHGVVPCHAVDEGLFADAERMGALLRVMAMRSC